MLARRGGAMFFAKNLEGRSLGVTSGSSNVPAIANHNEIGRYGLGKSILCPNMG